MAYLAWGPYDWQQSLGLRTVLLYADGEGLRIATDIDRRVSLDAEAFSVDEHLLLDVMSMAEEVWTRNGSERLVRLPDGVQIQDGGRTVFMTLDSDGRLTSTAVDQLGMVRSPAGSERSAFDELSSAIERLVENGSGGRPVTFDRVALVAADLPAVDADRFGRSSDRIASDLLSWEELSDGSACVVVPASELPPSLLERSGAWVSVPTGLIVIRPLLPHEESCQDVDGWHSLIAR